MEGEGYPPRIRSIDFPYYLLKTGQMVGGFLYFEDSDRGFA